MILRPDARAVNLSIGGYYKFFKVDGKYENEDYIDLDPKLESFWKKFHYTGDRDMTLDQKSCCLCLENYDDCLEKQRVALRKQDYETATKCFESL